MMEYCLVFGKNKHEIHVIMWLFLKSIMLNKKRNRIRQNGVLHEPITIACHNDSIESMVYLRKVCMPTYKQESLKSCVCGYVFVIAGQKI